MGYSRKQFDAVGLDLVAWQTYFHRYQQSYIRLKLRCLQSYALGHSPEQIGVHLSLSSLIVRRYMAKYLRSGLAGLCQPSQRRQPSLLTEAQMLAFKTVLLSSTPHDHGLEGRIWTGASMKIYLQNTYQVAYKSGIYDLLERLNLSHQKAHADYGKRMAAPTNAFEQQAFMTDFAHTLLASDDKAAGVAFDEFSICEKPTAAYSWAEKNTRPTFKTDEKKEAGGRPIAPTGS